MVYIEKLPWQKIWHNQESGLTNVWLKWDPPVHYTYVMLHYVMLLYLHYTTVVMLYEIMLT